MYTSRSRFRLGAAVALVTSKRQTSSAVGVQMHACDYSDAKHSHTFALLRMDNYLNPHIPQAAALFSLADSLLAHVYIYIYITLDLAARTCISPPADYVTDDRFLRGKKGQELMNPGH
ncbi:hypothetical protein HYPSUDRAFT_431113 [Hypholoma sublateritium FD-334 SS-4]|uniref:Uncharacterized protein n=1 Tax=Hypholoma sublateritium (strain FD-334 SS-4) TaxID=945553 RepID=A0A0D2LUR5_HYPSF|nr:hypothetical protein HYPSUDRAFT_431113 [Hypholoma sublateritium FD-334 SS-4]